ncbi:hypothetical protein TNCV_599741 [Trichonephila clavipes]|nr:hypothetical protein TNCV_599741 [Trichonephila clavipes]
MGDSQRAGGVGWLKASDKGKKAPHSLQSPSPLPWGPSTPRQRKKQLRRGECKRLGYNLSERKEEFELGIRAYSCTLELFDN